MEEEQNIAQLEESHEDQECKNNALSTFYQNNEEKEHSLFIPAQRDDGYLLEQEVIDACQSINTSPRKRKIDKEGFVTPATPDIPKSSSHHKQMRVEGISPNENKEQYNLEQSTDPASDQLLEEDCTVTQMSSQKTIQAGRPIVEVIKDMSEETKNVHDQFFKMFSESEEYETQCPDKLDKLIGEAKALEENLNQQKQVLCSRLKGLSRTLQLL